MYKRILPPSTGFLSVAAVDNQERNATSDNIKIPTDLTENILNMLPLDC